jgi:hypothetical protein
VLAECDRDGCVPSSLGELTKLVRQIA